MTKKNNWDWNTKEKLIANTLEWKKERFPAWEFNTGNLCWFINGTIYQGKAPSDWYEKIKFYL